MKQKKHFSGKFSAFFIKSARTKKILAGLVTVLNIVSAIADTPELADPAFELDGRKFSRTEALLLSGGSAGSTEQIRERIRQNYPTAAAMVLCERSGIKLSPEHTRLSLENARLTMPPARQRMFEEALKNEKLTLDSWLERESSKLTNQINDAVRRWYIKKYGNRQEITDRHIQNWYYRNQHIFRRTRLAAEEILIFDRERKNNWAPAWEMLKQGVPTTAARKQYANDTPPEDILEELQQYKTRRKILDDTWMLIDGSQHTFLLKKSALQQTYLPLDEELTQAIGNVLYDALAKARLAETLKTEFAGKNIIFY